MKQASAKGLNEQENPLLKRCQPLLGTFVELALVEEDPEKAAVAFNKAFLCIRSLENILSYFKPDSDIGRINSASKGDVLRINPHTAFLLHLSQRLCVETEGLFDINIGSRLHQVGDVQSPAHDYKILKNTGGHAIKLCQKLDLDLGGIAKGYCVDKAVSLLLSIGIKGGSINAGGDLRIFGPASHLVYLRDAVTGEPSNRSLSLRRKAVATSAAYFSEDGLTSRIVDCKTKNRIRGQKSVSVLAQRLTLADALTKIAYSNQLIADKVLKKYGAQVLYR